MRIVLLVLLTGALLRPGIAKAFDLGGNEVLFSGADIGVSAGSARANQGLLNLQEDFLAQVAREQQIANIALLQEKKRLSPILNCQAPAASPLSFAFIQCLTGR